MPEVQKHPDAVYKLEESSEGLRQALLRLTQPHYADLKADLERLEKRIVTLVADRKALDSEDEKQADEIANLNQLADQLGQLIDSISSGISDLSSQLKELETLLRAEVATEILQVEGSIAGLKSDLVNEKSMSQRLRPVLVPTIHNRVREDSRQFAAAISPVIGPAIRHQIRSARQDIIDALYPVIGNIISKAMSEELRTLSRKIDGQLKQQLNFRKRLAKQFARLRGISEGELLLRDALPFSIEHVFLVHQDTGLLLAHQHVEGEVSANPDLIGGMMTAIGDFVKDSFGKGESALEEITYGEKRIMIEAARHAYVAVVLEGVEPSGYNHLVCAMIKEINLKAEEELEDFNGVMQNLPDFREDLQRLLIPDPDTLAAYDSPEALERGQRVVVGVAVLGLLFFAIGVSLACLYAVRLWPLVFP